MQQINPLLSLVQANSNLGLPMSSDRKRDKPWSLSTEKLVTLLFTRMADLFGSKAASRGLIIFSDAEKGIYSEAFELWCRKLDDLTPENFKTGFDGLERKTESDYREGAEMWPPSYAEFRALAFPKTNRDSQAHKLFERLPALEDQTAKAKRYELGKQKTGELLDMLGVKRSEAVHSNEFAASRLEQARKMLEEKNASQ